MKNNHNNKPLNQCSYWELLERNSALISRLASTPINSNDISSIRKIRLQAEEINIALKALNAKLGSKVRTAGLSKQSSKLKIVATKSYCSNCPQRKVCPLTNWNYGLRLKVCPVLLDPLPLSGTGSKNGTLVDFLNRHIQ